MSLTIITAASLLMMPACTGAPRPRQEVAGGIGAGGMGASGLPDGGAATPARTQVELQDIRFDGQSLSGRLLVTAEEGSLLLDTRLIESVVLTTESVVECGTGRKLSFLEMDVLARPPRDEDLLMLKPGYWYGKDVRIPLFTEGLNGPEVACIEVEFTFHPREGRAASLRVRGTLSAPGDAGTTTPLPIPDAGAGAAR
ncbi:hypothetical protein [Pyxidicoccus trucidator]|uniref:hypothetical protein n=1 Tax=Pyxidicoccus trucidator TaxID=2709662 RepID=UPI0013DA0A7E|nr:hypothetical protein [Pyxidicoccus trucidator]